MSHRSRSAFPYLTPFTDQLVLPGGAGLTRSTIIPTKPSHCVSRARTASANAASSAVWVMGVRLTSVRSAVFGLISHRAFCVTPMETFAEAAHLTEEQVRATVLGGADAPCWSAAERALIAAVD